MTTKIKQDKIKDDKGRALLVSTVRFTDGTYEIGVFTDSMEELKISQCWDEDCALRIHREYIAEYTAQEVELPERYKRLAETLKVAVMAAKAVAGGEDGGTCNFDSMMLAAPKWNQKFIEAAAQKAGIRVFATRIFRCKFYVFSVPFAGQGNARTRQAEAMAQAMEAAGYDASVYYQMD